MKRVLFCCSLLLGCAASQPRAEAPAPGLRYAFLMAGRNAGVAVTTVRGRERDSHFEFNDRGRGPSLDAHFSLGEGEIPTAISIRGHDYLKSPVEERYDGATRSWKNKSEQGSSSAAGRSLYVPLAGVPEAFAVLARALLHAPDGKLPLLPQGEARIARAGERIVEAGGTRAHLTQYSVDGLGFLPARLWLDDAGELFGAVDTWSSVVREGFEKVVPELIAAQDESIDAHLSAIARAVMHRPQGPIAITHARLFDSEEKRAVDDVTIVVEGGRIAQVGPSAKVSPPEGAEVIDAGGKTVLPGLWDMHVHLGDGDGLLHVAHGVTTVRDLANDMDKVERLRKRFTEGTELGPNLILAGFIDGRGPFAGPTKVFADTEEEARAAVDRYAERGYAQIKIYSSVKPELVPGIIARAHAKGLRVSGHVPAHMIAEDAVRAGFDELQHINFVILNFLGTREDDTRNMLRFTLPGDKAGDLDLESAAVRDFVALLASRRVVVDPTVAAFEAMFTDRPGEMSRLVRAVADRLPPQVARGFLTGGLPVADAAQDARYRRSTAKLLEMVRLLWSKGVPLVAGTDDLAGFALMRELELYAQAGIPNAEVLHIATLGAARVMKRDATSGSLAAGKDADLVILDGDPLARISDLRKAVLVMKGGITVRPAEVLRAMNVAPYSASKR